MKRKPKRKVKAKAPAAPMTPSEMAHRRWSRTKKADRRAGAVKAANARWSKHRAVEGAAPAALEGLKL
jgi:hypothetical protein